MSPMFIFLFINKKNTSRTPHYKKFEAAPNFSNHYLAIPSFSKNACSNSLDLNCKEYAFIAFFIFLDFVCNQFIKGKIRSIDFMIPKCGGTRDIII